MNKPFFYVCFHKLVVFLDMTVFFSPPGFVSGLTYRVSVGISSMYS